MRYATLGRTALEVSRLCLGTMNFGPEASERDAFDIMDRALDRGINFFDTANAYGGKAGKGGTEEILGRWFAQGGGRREKVVLATKVYGKMDDWPNESRLSARHIQRACDDSLRRLQTDHIDLYQMHHVWRPAPWEEIWQAMDRLVAQGKVLYVGSSNFAAWHIVQANAVARSRHSLGLVSEQSLYNLTERTVELEVLPACESEGIAVLPWSPLAGGLLAGAAEKAKQGRRASETTQKRLEKHGERVPIYEGLCRELGQDPATIALCWLVKNPVVTAPIIGPRTIDQLESALPALEIELEPETVARLEEIFPGPAGPAPEAYAW